MTTTKCVWNYSMRLPNATTKYKKIVEKKQIYELLLGFNKNLDDARGWNLATKQLPNLQEIAAEIRWELPNLMSNFPVKGRQYFSTLKNKDSKIILWLYCVGHLNILYIKKLFFLLFNHNSIKFQCESCQISKHVQNIYPI